MVRTHHFKLGIVLLPLISACSGSSGNSPASTPTVDTSTYQVKAETSDKLAHVGCFLSTNGDQKLDCKDPGFAATDDHLSDLQSNLDFLQRRLPVLQAADKNLNEDIQAHTLGTNAQLQAVNLDTDLQLVIVATQLQIGQLQADIASEGLYQTVLGYRCHSPNVDKMLLTSDTTIKNVKVDLLGNEAQVQYLADQNILRISGQSIGPDNLTYWTETSGELHLQVGQSPSVTCDHMRTLQMPAGFTDRPLLHSSGRRIECFVNGILAGKTAVGGGLPLNMDENKTTELSEGLWSANANLTFPYQVRAVMADGQFTIQAYESTDPTRTVLQAATIDSGKNITMSLRDGHQNGVDVTCKFAVTDQKQ